MVVCGETRPRRRRRFLNVLVTLLVVNAVTVTADQDIRRRRSVIDDDDSDVGLNWRQRRTPGAVREGPPIKPEHFLSVAELNKYLADLNEYYTVLGRPRSVRFGFSGD